MITTMSNEMNDNTEDDQPWYKQWMVWMVIAPPLTAVIAGIITINIAIESDDGLVVDDYYKQGLGINQTLQRDHLARKMNIEADLFVETKQIKLRFNNELKQTDLTLHFIHPTQSQRDVRVVMNYFSDNAYQAELPGQLSGNWNLLLEPADKSWRVSGRINFQKQSSSRLIPNLK